MCASCGCGKLEDDHGDERNLTQKDLQDAAEAAGISVGEVTKNIQTANGGQSSAYQQGQAGQTRQEQGAFTREQEVPGAE